MSGFTVICHDRDLIPISIREQADLVLVPEKPCHDVLDLWVAEWYTVVKGRRDDVGDRYGISVRLLHEQWELSRVKVIVMQNSETAILLVVGPVTTQRFDHFIKETGSTVLIQAPWNNIPKKPTIAPESQECADVVETLSRHLAMAIHTFYDRVVTKGEQEVSITETRHGQDVTYTMCVKVNKNEKEPA
jgi:hypothetical protein